MRLRAGQVRLWVDTALALAPRVPAVAAAMGQAWAPTPAPPSALAVALAPARAPVGALQAHLRLVAKAALRADMALHQSSAGGDRAGGVGGGGGGGGGASAGATAATATMGANHGPSAHGSWHQVPLLCHPSTVLFFGGLCSTRGVDDA